MLFMLFMLFTLFPACYGVYLPMIGLRDERMVSTIPISIYVHTNPPTASTAASATSGVIPQQNRCGLALTAQVTKPIPSVSAARPRGASACLRPRVPRSRACLFVTVRTRPCEQEVRDDTASPI
jgi:hypothetical protein